MFLPHRWRSSNGQPAVLLELRAIESSEVSPGVVYYAGMDALTSLSQSRTIFVHLQAKYKGLLNERLIPQL